MAKNTINLLWPASPGCCFSSARAESILEHFCEKKIKNSIHLKARTLVENTIPVTL
jgi:hypothetical protein